MNLVQYNLDVTRKCVLYVSVRSLHQNYSTDELKQETKTFTLTKKQLKFLR